VTASFAGRPDPRLDTREKETRRAMLKPARGCRLGGASDQASRGAADEYPVD
jgi:hypothetical protein